MALHEDDAPASKQAARKAGANGDVQRFEKILSDHLGTKVTLKVGAKDKGQLQIAFHGWEHLNALLEKQGLSALLQQQED